ncbi:o-succinylbenzoate synthase [Microcoleus sp. FACHB-831]|uniref:o-succinylbenzoate synthase n=1 Tax=Microcoleus sp. FACHB-831 TaxID=2692827 RepID=UPI0016880D82|nr:o-succinylbenzoate synthase [Microcoleus sp. FACHB-831]MBD1923133.1 o-succinylbenzoate synthase [Microcoleus sp. FACHB-831]
MQYRFDFRPYRRHFKRPLQISKGIWDIREGIILRLTDENEKIGFGEIAPLSWFGSETFADAWDFCRELPNKITAETIFSIPAALPACQFGFESALDLALVNNSPSKIKNLNAQITYSGLLPAGEAVLNQWQPLWERGYRTFKWKIGVAPIQQELNIFNQLIQSIPESVKLRLDANGGLSWEETNAWLNVGDRASYIEFIEQPLPINKFAAMLELAGQHSTPIALDESVATIEQLQACYQQGWRGIFVIKPAIAGSSSRLRQFCQQHTIDAVFSSVFETPIGRQAALQLAAELSRRDRAVGFGVNHWFDEDDETSFENLWNRL